MLALACLVAPAARAQNAYIANADPDGVTLSVIDPATNNLVGSPITLGAFEPSRYYSFTGVAVPSDGFRVYVSSGGDGSVWVIDAVSGSVIDTISVGPPLGLAVAPDGQRLYVVNGQYPDGNPSVSVIDTASNTVIGTVTLANSGPQDRAASALVVTPNGRKVYVGVSRLGVAVIDTASMTLIDTIAGTDGVGISANGLAVTADGLRVYAANPNNSVSVIDTGIDTVLATITLATSPAGLVVTPDGHFVYVLNSNSAAGSPGTVSVIDAATNTVVDTITVASPHPTGLAMTPIGSRVYVVNNNYPATGSVSEIDTASNTVVGTITVPFRNTYGTSIGIQPPPLKFAGLPGIQSCYGKSVSALAVRNDGIKGAAASLGFPNVAPLLSAIQAFCVVGGNRD